MIAVVAVTTFLSTITFYWDELFPQVERPKLNAVVHQINGFYWVILGLFVVVLFVIEGALRLINHVEDKCDSALETVDELQRCLTEKAPRIVVEVVEETDRYDKPITGIILKNVGTETAYKVTPADFTIKESIVSFYSVPTIAVGAQSNTIYAQIKNWSPLSPNDLAGKMMREWGSMTQKEISFPAFAEYTNHDGSIRYRVDWDFKLFPFDAWLRRQRKSQATYCPDTRRPHLVADNFRYSQLRLIPENGVNA